MTPSSSATAWAYSALRELGNAQRAQLLRGGVHSRLSLPPPPLPRRSHASRLADATRSQRARRERALLLPPRPPQQQEQHTPPYTRVHDVHASASSSFATSAAAARVVTDIDALQPHVLLLRDGVRAAVTRALLLAPLASGGVVGVEVHDTHERLDVDEVMAMSALSSSSSATRMTGRTTSLPARVHGLLAYLHQRNVRMPVATAASSSSLHHLPATQRPLLVHNNHLLGYCLRHRCASPLYAHTLPQLLQLRRAQLRSLSPAQCLISTQYAMWCSWRDVWAEPAWDVCTADVHALDALLRGTLRLRDLGDCCTTLTLAS